MNVLIIEDELPATKRLISLISEIEPTWTVVNTIDEVKSSIQWLQNNPSPDLIFMDIQLADGFSFEIFKSIDISAQVIFATAFDQYALDAFKVNGLDYLLKPINKSELIQSISRFKSLNHSPSINYEVISNLLAERDKDYKSRFIVKSGDQFNFVKVNEIAYFFSEDSYSFIMTRSKTDTLLMNLWIKLK